MKISFKIVFILNLFLLSGLSLSAQDVKVVKYPDLLAMIDDCGAEKIKVYNFWATWCGPCVEEMPHLEHLHRSNENVEVVLFSFDPVSKLDSKVIPFIKKKEITATVILVDETDYNEFIDKIASEWSGAIPATLIKDCKTGERWFYEKKFNEGELESIINNL